MSDLTIQIGKGESKTIRFNITTTMFQNTDKLLFAIKNEPTSREYVFTYEQLIYDTPIQDNKYIFTIVITTEQSRSMSLKKYYYDLTLIDQYGEEKPLIKPQEFIITSTIGASLPKAGA